ncbi:MAG: hypothetical protein ACE5E9_12100, partial [Nitrospinaceae bacterium]
MKNAGDTHSAAARKVRGKMSLMKHLLKKMMPHEKHRTWIPGLMILWILFLAQVPVASASLPVLVQGAKSLPTRVTGPDEAKQKEFVRFAGILDGISNFGKDVSDFLFGGKTSGKDSKARARPSRRESPSRTETASPGYSSREPSFEFDHFATGFPLTGGHKRASCESCHVRGKFKGVSRKCSTCHDQGGTVGATHVPYSHIKTTQTCELCHTTGTWSRVTRVDHSAVQGTCFSCHNWARTKGKNANHIPSTNQCENCHNTTSWAKARFDHVGVTGRCFRCHDQTTAKGKTPTHMATADTCEDCHNTSSWSSIKVDHAAIQGTCLSCHNGKTAKGKYSGHISSSNQCEDCH